MPVQQGHPKEVCWFSSFPRDEFPDRMLLWMHARM